MDRQPKFDSPPTKRSSRAMETRRTRQSWPESRRFNILAVDGGGIRGLFPASILALLEESGDFGVPIGSRFDLISGTSTGGIISLGLAAGLSASQMKELYLNRGEEIFPPRGPGVIGTIWRKVEAIKRMTHYSYDSLRLEGVLGEYLGDLRLKDLNSRVCIPAFEGFHGEVFIFKTPHHPDYTLDGDARLVDVALATAAAPTYFRARELNRHLLVDGGVWANNPIMIALVEALSAFEVAPENIRILSISCGRASYTVNGRRLAWGGNLFWRDIINAAMDLQSQNALGQAGLLIGPQNIVRVEPPEHVAKIGLDDWKTAVEQIPNVVEEIYQGSKEKLERLFA